jgi:peptide/nickel transport system permease protein
MTTPTVLARSLARVAQRRRLIPRGTFRSPAAVIGTTVVAFAVLAAVFGPLVWTVEPDALVAVRLQGPSWAHPFGTDELGRDTLARILHGARASLEIGIVAVAVAAVGGVIIGLASAYYRGWLDVALMRLVDVMFALPALVLAILIAGLLGPSRGSIMFAVGLAYTPAFARVVRSAALAIMAQPYIEAARALGTSGPVILSRHLFPNVVAPLIVMASGSLGTAILTEASLSFIGLGIQPPDPSWGGMLSGARPYMVLSPWLAIFPGVAIMLLVLGTNLLGDALRDGLDPRLGRRG